MGSNGANNIQGAMEQTTYRGYWREQHPGHGGANIIQGAINGTTSMARWSEQHTGLCPME